MPDVSNNSKSSQIDPRIKAEIEHYERLGQTVLPILEALKEQKDELTAENLRLESEVEKINSAQKEIIEQHKNMQRIDNRIVEMEREFRNLQKSINEKKSEIEQIKKTQEKKTSWWQKIHSRKDS